MTPKRKESILYYEAYIHNIHNQASYISLTFSNILLWLGFKVGFAM